MRTSPGLLGGSLEERTEDDSRLERLRRMRTPSARASANRYVAPGLIVVSTLLLILVSPLLGALAATCFFVAVVPIAATLSGRIVGTFSLFCGLIAIAVVALALADQPFDLLEAKVIGTVPAVVAAGVLLFSRGRRHLLVRPDLEAIPLGTTALLGWLVTGGTLLHRPQGSVMGGLSALGWDHQSHFSIFVNMYTLEGVWRPSSGVPRPSFDAYPPLGAALSSFGVWLVDGRVVPTDTLVTRYAQAAAVMAAISVALLSWLAAVLAAALAGPSGMVKAPRGVPALAGVAVGGYLCLGPVMSFFDYGFSNFLLACAIAATTSWLVLASLDDRPGRSAGLLAAGVAATSLLWTPLLLLLAPAGVVLAWRLLVRRPVRWTAGFLLLPLLAAAVPLWQARRIIPDRSVASGLSQTVGSVAGGLPPVPLAQALGYITLGLVLLLLGPPTHRRFWWAALAPAAAGLLLAAGFAANSYHAGTHAQHSYYFAKAAWSLYIVAVPILGAVFGLAVAAASRMVAQEDSNRPHSQRERLVRGLRVGLAALGATALLWASLGYGNTPGSKTGYVAVPPAVDSVPGRWSVFRAVDAGNLVYSASRSIGKAPGRIPIIWDGGDLKQNRWLASLREQLDGRADAVYNPLPGGPYLQPAVDALRASLLADPSLAVAVAYFLPETAELLEPLVQEFPERVRLVVMQ